MLLGSPTKRVVGPLAELSVDRVVGGSVIQSIGGRARGEGGVCLVLEDI